jgi:CheY-like chemotaxis protein
VGQQETRLTDPDFQSRRQGPASILVVDDEPGVRETLERLLGHEGFIVCVAGGIDEALDELEKTTFDAVVLDVHLPDSTGGKRSGIDVLVFIRNHERLRRIPVLMLTGGDLTDAEEKTILGLQSYVLNKSEGWRTLYPYLKHLTATTTSNDKAKG